MSKKRGEREGNRLSDWWDVINKCADEHQQRNNEFLKALGTPHMFIPTKEPRDETDKSGTAFWRVAAGVLVMPVYYSGRPDVDARHLYEDDFIEILKSLKKLKAEKR